MLGPVCSLEEVVEFEHGLMCLVRELFVHGPGVEIPQGGPAHDV